MITEVLKRGDPRLASPEVAQARRKELEGLEARNAWRVVHASELPDNTTDIGGRFVDAIKNVETDHPSFKA